jgi:flagellar protein FlaG
MDINTHTLQQQSAAITPLNSVNTKPSMDSSVKSVADTNGKAEAPSVSTAAAAAVAAEAKNTKNSNNLKKAVSQLNDHVQTMQRALLFSVDKGSGTVVVKIIDTESKQVIRQIPTEEALRMAQDLTTKENKAAFNIFSSRA